MSSTLFIIIMLIVLIGLWCACVSGPRWFARSLHKHKLWAVRDELVDDIIDGHLPRDHDAVRQLVKQMDTKLRLGPNITLSDVLIFGRQLGKINPSARQYLVEAKCPLDGLTKDQRELMTSYRDRFGRLCVSLLLLGSWFGFICVTAVFVGLSALTAWRLVKQWRDVSLDAVKGLITVTAYQAADKIIDSGVGHLVSKTLPALPKDYAPVHASVVHPRQLFASFRGWG